MSEKAIISGNIHKFRKAKGYTQKKLAELMGVPAPTYYCWENGRVEPGIKRLKEIATVLEVTVSDIIAADDWIKVDTRLPKDQDEKTFVRIYALMDNGELNTDAIYKDERFYVGTPLKDVTRYTTHWQNKPKNPK